MLFVINPLFKDIESFKEEDEVDAAHYASVTGGILWGIKYDISNAINHHMLKLANKMLPEHLQVETSLPLPEGDMFAVVHTALERWDMYLEASTETVRG